MDEIHLGNNFRDAPYKANRKLSKFGCLVVIVLFLIGLTGAMLAPVVDYQWFLHDMGHPEVFTRRYEVESFLFLGSFLAAYAMMSFNLRLAFKLGESTIAGPQMSNPAMVSLYDFVRRNGQSFLRILAILLALLFAAGFSGNWNEYLLASHAQAFGKVDPLFGMDLGFFVFKLPWYRSLANFALGITTLTSILALGVYIGLQALAALAKFELSRPAIRRHLSILAGIAILCLAASKGLGCFEYGLIDGDQFTGAGFTMVRELKIQEVLAALIGVLGIFSILSAWTTRTFRPLIVGAVLTAGFAIIGTGIVPEVIQRFLVDPNKVVRESPYAQRAIAMTQFGYGLDQIDYKDVSVAPQPSPEEVANAKTTLENMRLWDPYVIRAVNEQKQGLRPFYTFNDVDVDRYTIDGRQQTVMIASRDFNPSGLSSNASFWVNRHMEYTHGYGVVMTTVNSASPDGDPEYLIRDMPVKSIPELPVTRPQIYFGHFHEDQEPYVLVHTRQREYDYPSESGTGSEGTEWQGQRGIPVGRFWDRLLFSAALGDGNLLVSPSITDSTKLLMHRDVLERASLLLPFLDFDPDPYIVILNGKLLWVLDGYTSSDRLPYSQHAPFFSGEVNYVRNSVKVTIDAYTGEVNAYTLANNEPVLQCWRSIFPNLIKDFSQLPKGLDAHLRYPEGLLNLQAQLLREYHVADPSLFLTNGDAWDIPVNRGLEGSTEPLKAYYVEMRLPDEPKDGFMLILPFTPMGRNTMSGWLAGQCDPGDYGKLILYKFPKGVPVDGPALAETKFNQDPTVANINRQLNNDQSQILVGNLLVIPIGRSVIYVEPLYLRSRTAGIQAPPQLREVILAVQGRIVVGQTYREALDKLFGTDAGRAPTTLPAQTGYVPGPSAPALSATEIGKVREALELFDQADAALKSGDFAKYGELQKKVRGRLEEALGK